MRDGDPNRPAGAPVDCPHVVARGEHATVGGAPAPFEQRCGRPLIWRDPVAGEPPSCYCRRGHEFVEHDGHLVPDVDDDGQGDELQAVQRDGETFLQAGRAGDRLAGAPDPNAGGEVPPAWRQTAADLAELREAADAALQSLEVVCQTNPEPAQVDGPLPGRLFLLAAARELLERPTWRAMLGSAFVELLASSAREQIDAEVEADPRDVDLRLRRAVDRLQTAQALARTLERDDELIVPLAGVPDDARG